MDGIELLEYELDRLKAEIAKIEARNPEKGSGQAQALAGLRTKLTGIANQLAGIRFARLNAYVRRLGPKTDERMRDEAPFWEAHLEPEEHERQEAERKRRAARRFDHPPKPGDEEKPGTRLHDRAVNALARGQADSIQEALRRRPVGPQNEPEGQEGKAGAAGGSTG